MSLKGKVSGSAQEMAESPAAERPTVKRINRGTDQQEALWAELANGSRHVLGEARAGCGKSSSCREAMWRMLERDSRLRIRYSVFNRANADEFRPACPPGVEVATSHSFGYQALKSACKSQVEKNKTYLILDETPAGRQLPRYIRKSVAMLVGHAKNQCFDPQMANAELQARLAELLIHYDVKDYGRRSLITGWAAEILEKSATWTEIVDFDDMLWLPALHKIPFPECDVLFLDEVQDFNPAQQALVPLMCSSGRVVIVGDRYQAINAFRGADMDSIPNLSASLGAADRGLDSYPLTVTFRCPASHVCLANKYVPDLQAHESAPEGVIEYGAKLESLVEQCQPGDLVICPTNAPVVKACLELVRRRRPAYVRGRALGDQLVSLLRGLPDGSPSALTRGVEQWRAKELGRLAELDGVEDIIERTNDQADSLQAVLAASDSASEAEQVIGQVFSDDRRRDGVVTFSTIHRAKGDEAETVWLIEAPQREPKRDWEARQQANLRYVALTRSKHRLVFVDHPKN